VIGDLPTNLEVEGREYEIRSDFRVALLIFQAYSDNDLTDYEKARVCVECLYKEIPEDYGKAIEKALWFLDGGDMPKSKKAPKKIMDWEQDESIIFPAVNKVAGYETRRCEYLHWWSFLGLFNEVGEGLYSSVMNIRSKKAKGKKLEKWEKEFYNDHKELVDLKHKPTAEEQAELDLVTSIIG
jgi:hypothetical protein